MLCCSCAVAVAVATYSYSVAACKGQGTKARQGKADAAALLRTCAYQYIRYLLDLTYMDLG
jgi:hypothetical protein